MKKLFTILVLVVFTIFTSCEKQEEEELKGRRAKIVRITDKDDRRYNELAPSLYNLIWRPYSGKGGWFLTVIDVETKDTVAMKVTSEWDNNDYCSYYAIYYGEASDSNFTRYDENTEYNEWIEGEVD
tara:strand:- start:64 stop:444 length:381 start_codon:yes stop_codon:yes gene_type:complete